MKVLITGSTQGIGLAIAKAFVSRGDEVIVHCSTDIDKAKNVCKSIGGFAAVTCDLADANAGENLYSKTGAVDFLILNASVQYKEDWTAVSEQTLEKQLAVNFKSTFKLIQAYSSSMKEKGFGRIITIGSVNQYREHPELTVYSATKCAVMSLVKNIAKQIAPYGVTINNISPGAIDTPRNSSVFTDVERRKVIESAIPMGRIGTPEDCVGAVLFLCAKESKYITGTDILVDGGMHLN